MDKPQSATFVVVPKVLVALFGLDAVGPATVDSDGVLRIPVIDKDGSLAPGQEVVGRITRLIGQGVSLSWEVVP